MYICTPMYSLGSAHAMGSFFYFYSYFLFWLCTFLISRLALDTKLLQRLGVIDIILILIYYFYRKKKALSLPSLVSQRDVSML
jgi:hypothetical protein